MIYKIDRVVLQKVFVLLIEQRLMILIEVNIDRKIGFGYVEFEIVV